MGFESLIKARKVLDPLWQEAMLKGRCWGPKKTNNPFSATNITLAVGNELVSISQKEDTLLIHEFSKTKDTLLGNKIRDILCKAGLKFSSG